MTTKRILLVGTPRPFDAALMPLLSRQGFEIDRLSASLAVVELVGRIRFDLIGIGADIQGPSLLDLIEELRFDGAKCRSSSVIVVVEGEMTPTVRSALAAGANFVLTWPMGIEEALAAFARLLDVSPRMSARFITKIAVNLATGEKKLFAQSENLSATGILIQVGEALAIGTELDLEFSVPGDPAPIRCRGKVVRHADVPGKSARRIGVQFVSYAGDSETRLKKLVGKI